MSTRHHKGRNEFTAGPYEVARTGDGCDEVICIVDARRRDLATIYLPWNLTVERERELAANARLFAMAPRLAEALEDLVVAVFGGDVKACDAAVAAAIEVIDRVRFGDEEEQQVRSDPRIVSAVNCRGKQP